MAQQGRLHIGVDMNLNKSKYQEVKSALESLRSLTSKDLINSTNAKADLNDIITTAKKLEDALEKSFSPKLNSINLTKFKRELGDLNLKTIESQFAKAGAAGQNAFRNLSVELMTTNKHIKESSALLDKMATTLANTVRWQVATTALNAMTGSVQKAYYFTKDLDTSLNDIMIVTEKSADEMGSFAKQANKAAKELRALTTDYTKASLIYYQQGLSDQEVATRAETTVKVANITKQSADTVSEQLTAIWNGYKVNAAEAEVYIDKVSAVAARTAADLQELASGMSKVASAANIMGVDIDQLNAQLATIVSVTREAPESIGTALKTVYARMSDIEAGLDTETTLGEYTAQMKTLGINALDANGNLRDQGEVIEEIGAKWKSLNREQQTALSQTIAGTRQYSRMMALFDNWAMYEDALKASQNSLGALQNQQDTYAKSIEAHLATLGAEGEELYATLFDAEDITPMIDAITSVVGGVENLVEALGGGKGLIAILGSVGLNVFGDKITQSIGRTVRNIKGFTENLKQESAETWLRDELKETELLNTKTGQELLDLQRQQLKLGKNITDEESAALKEVIKGRIEKEATKKALEEQEKILKRITKAESDSDFNKILESPEEKIKNLKKDITSLQADLTPDTYKIELQQIQELIRERNRITNARSQKTQASNKINVTDIELTAQKTQEQIKIAAEANQKMKSLEEDFKSSASAILLNKEGQDYGGWIPDLIGRIELLQQEYQLTEEDAKSLVLTLQQLNKIQEKVSKGDILDPSDLTELENAFNTYHKVGQETLDTYKKGSVALKEHKKAVNENTEALEKYRNKTKELKEGFDLTKTIEQFVTWSGATANLITGVITLANLGDIWNNENLTGWEKFGQTLTNIATSASMISAPILSAYGAYKKFNIERNKSLIASTAAIFAEGKVTDEFKDQIAAILLNSDALDKNTKDTYENIVAKIVEGKALDDTEQSFVQDAIEKHNKDTSSKTYFKDKIDTARDTANRVKDATVKGLTNLGNTKAGSFVGRISGAQGGMAAGIATAGTVAVALAAVAAGIYLTVKAYNAQADALKEANEYQKLMNDNLTEAQQKYDQVAQSIKGYSDQLATLKELTEGTTEWKDAILETNNAALKLLNTYPELADYMTTDNGVITISEEGLIQYQNKERARVSAAQMAATNATQRQRQAQLEYDTAMLVRKSSSNNFFFGDELENFIDELANGDYAKALEENNYQSKELKQALEKNPVALQELTLAVKRNNELLEIENRANYAEIYRQQGYSNEQAAILAGMAGASDADRDKAIAKRADQIRLKEGSNKELIQRWAEAMGINIDEGSISGVGGDNFNYTVDGDKKKISYNQLAFDLATYEYAQQQTDKSSTAEYEKKLEDIYSKLNATEQKDIINSIIANGKALDIESLGNFDQNTIIALNKAISQLPNDIKEAAKETMKNMSLAISDPAQAFGVNQDVIDSILAGAGQSDWATLFKQIGSEAATQWTDLGQQFLTSGGSSGLQAFENFVKVLTKEGATDALKEVDFTTSGWMTDLKRLAPELDTNSDEFKSFAYYLSKLYPTAETAEDRIKNLNEILDDLGQRGDKLDKEAFTKLSSYMEEVGVNTDEYFVKMADGTYMLTTAAAAFNKTAREAEQAILRKAIEEEYQKGKKWQGDVYNTALRKTFKTTETEDTEYQKQLEKERDAQRQVEANKVYMEAYNAAKQKYGNIVPNSAIDELEAAGNAARNKYLKETPIERISSSQYTKVTYNQEEVVAWLNELNGLGLLAEDEYNTFMAQAKDPQNLSRYENQKSLRDEIYAVVKNNITTTEFNDTAFRENIEALLAGTQSETEYNSLLEEIQKRYGVDFSDTTESAHGGKTWAEIAASSKKAVGITEDQNKINAYNSSLEATEAALTGIENELSRLSELSNLVYGQDAIDNLDAQNAALDKQIYLLGLKANLEKAEIERRLNDKGSELYNAIKTLGGNPSDIRTADDYYAFVKAAGEEVIKAQETGDAKWVTDALNTVMEQLGPLFSEATQQAIDSANYTKLSNNLAKFQMQIELALDATDAQKTYQSFLRDMTDDLSDIGNTYLSDAESYYKSIEINTKALQALEGMKVIDDDEFKALKEVQEGMISAADYRAQKEELINALMADAKSLREATLAVQEKQVEAAEEVAAAQKKQIDYLNVANSMLETQVELTQLIYGDDSTHLEKFYDRILENNQLIKKDAASSYNYWRELYVDPNFKTMSEEYQEKVKEELTSATESYMSAIHTTAQSMQDKYLYQLQQSIKKFKVEATGDEWNWIKAEEDDYLDSIKSLYAIEDLESTFKKAANESQDIKTQQRINTLLDEELSILEKRDKLTQYDFDRAKKKLDILQAEIALQEAQNSTTSMRLMRGADGTYSYQYVADADAIAEKQEELRKANESLYELDTDRYRESLDQFYDVYSEYVAKIEEAASDGYISPEEEEELAQFQERLDSLADTAVDVQSNLRESAKLSVEALGGSVDDINKALDDKLNSGLSEIIQNVSKNGIQVVFADLLKTVQENATSYYAAVQAEETTLNNLLGDGETGSIALYQQLARDQNAVIKQTKDEKLAVDNLVTSLEKMNKQYTDAITNVRNLAAAWAQTSAVESEASIEPNTSKFEGRVESSQRWLNLSHTQTGGNQFKDTESIYAAREYFTKALDWIESNTGSGSLGSWFKYNARSGTAQSYDELKESLLNSSTTGYHQNSQDYWLLDRLILAVESGMIGRFDTGGYTGEWGNSGKLAILDEKELVLNETDTSNILLAVDTVRSLAASLDLAALQTQAKALAGLESSVAAWELANEMVIEQNVHIEASFPDASSESEIKAALLDLVNQASQHAYDNKRV